MKCDPGLWFEKPDCHHVCPQEAELDDSSLIGLSVPGDVAKKLLHYLKQKLPSSCLGDLLCSHAFTKHYLKRGGASLEDEELLGKKTNNTPLVRRVLDTPLSHCARLCVSAAESSSGLGGGGGGGQGFSSASTSSSSAMGSVSKKAKKELPVDSGCCNSETESDLPTEDISKYPDDLEDKMKGGGGACSRLGSGIGASCYSPVFFSCSV